MSDNHFISLVNLANEGVCGPITVLVDGQLISGVLIGAVTFLESTARLIAGDGSNQANVEYSRMFSEPAALMVERANELVEDDSFYLKDVVITNNGNRINFNGVFMKLKIDAVAGWFIGHPQ
ncbi:hypothetical protein [Aeromonas hydrophila]|uniref:hypothetical protein n=1 Tax=Aeromonas hydrophila TaxID=644 RepID=UPI002B4787BE|nr:hypothetical protein [Aeromonas hydrophila]